MKPNHRGVIPQIAFLLALGASAILMWHSHVLRVQIANIIYSSTLIGLYGVSAIYHSPMWSRRHYLIIRSIDHAAIFALIAGTVTPICLLGLKGKAGFNLILIMWIIAICGMLMAVFWNQSPKWLRAFLYIAMGWITGFYLPEIELAIGIENMNLLIIGGVVYTLGALIYAFKRPNPFPDVFGYHEIFHLLVVIASAFHFIVIYRLTV